MFYPTLGVSDVFGSVVPVQTAECLFYADNTRIISEMQESRQLDNNLDGMENLLARVYQLGCEPCQC